MRRKDFKNFIQRRIKHPGIEDDYRDTAFVEVKHNDSRQIWCGKKFLVRKTTNASWRATMIIFNTVRPLLRKSPVVDLNVRFEFLFYRCHLVLVIDFIFSVSGLLLNLYSPRRTFLEFQSIGFRPLHRVLRYISSDFIFVISALAP